MDEDVFEFQISAAAKAQNMSAKLFKKTHTILDLERVWVNITAERLFSYDQTMLDGYDD